MDVSTRSLITDPDLLSFTLAVVAPVGVLCGIASAIIGMPSWMFLTPLLFVNLNLPVLDAIFAAMLADLCNAVLLSLLYRKVAQLNYRYVAALGLACAVVGPPVALLTHKLLLEHEDWFKGGVAYATFATGLFFVVKGIFECRKERCSGKKAVFMEVDESDIDAHDAVAATRVQLTNPTSDDDDHDRDDDERDSRDVPVRFRARSSIVDDGYAPAFDSDRDSDSDDADNAALLGGKPTSIRRRASGLSPLQRQRSPCTQRVFTAMPVLAALGCAVFAGFLGMFGTVTVAGVLIGFRSYPLLRATAASLVITAFVMVSMTITYTIAFPLHPKQLYLVWLVIIGCSSFGVFLGSRFAQKMKNDTLTVLVGLFIMIMGALQTLQQAVFHGQSILPTNASNSTMTTDTQ